MFLVRGTLRLEVRRMRNGRTRSGKKFWNWTKPEAIRALYNYHQHVESPLKISFYELNKRLNNIFGEEVPETSLRAYLQSGNFKGDAQRSGLLILLEEENTEQLLRFYMNNEVDLPVFEELQARLGFQQPIGRIERYLKNSGLEYIREGIPVVPDANTIARGKNSFNPNDYMELSFEQILTDTEREAWQNIRGCVGEECEEGDTENEQEDSEEISLPDGSSTNDKILKSFVPGHNLHRSALERINKLIMEEVNENHPDQKVFVASFDFYDQLIAKKTDSTEEVRNSKPSDIYDYETLFFPVCEPGDGTNPDRYYLMMADMLDLEKVELSSFGEIGLFVFYILVIRINRSFSEILVGKHWVFSIIGCLRSIPSTSCLGGVNTKISFSSTMNRYQMSRFFVLPQNWDLKNTSRLSSWQNEYLIFQWDFRQSFRFG